MARGRAEDMGQLATDGLKAARRWQQRPEGGGSPAEHMHAAMQLFLARTREWD